MLRRLKHPKIEVVAPEEEEGGGEGGKGGGGKGGGGKGGGGKGGG